MSDLPVGVVQAAAEPIALYVQTWLSKALLEEITVAALDAAVAAGWFEAEMKRRGWRRENGHLDRLAQSVVAIPADTTNYWGRLLAVTHQRWVQPWCPVTDKETSE